MSLPSQHSQPFHSHVACWPAVFRTPVVSPAVVRATCRMGSLGRFHPPSAILTHSCCAPLPGGASPPHCWSRHLCSIHPHFTTAEPPCRSSQDIWTRCLSGNPSLRLQVCSNELHLHVSPYVVPYVVQELRRARTDRKPPKLSNPSTCTEVCSAPWSFRLHVSPFSRALLRIPPSSTAMPAPL